jgi:hypothetical protein
MNKEECDPILLIKIINSFKKFFKGKKINYTTLIVNGMEIIEKNKKLDGSIKKKYLIIAIGELAKGIDNISGTEDDIISLENMIILKKLIDENLLEDMIDIIADVSKGLFDINKSSKSRCRLLC